MQYRTREQHLAALQRGLPFAKRQIGRNQAGSSTQSGQTPIQRRPSRGGS